MSTFSVCTYNILAQSYINHSKKNGVDDTFCSFHTRYAKIVSYLKEHSDIPLIALQEVESNVFFSLEDELVHHQGLYTQRQNAKDGLAIFIRHECQVESFQSIVLHNEEGKARRVAQILDCIVEGEPIRIAHVHLDFDPRGKSDGLLQGTKMMNQLISMEPRQTVVLGDFNAQKDQPVFDLFRHHGFLAADTTKETCFHGTSWSRVDHVFYQASMQLSTLTIPDRCASIPNQNWGSDHLPLMCSFQLDED